MKYHFVYLTTNIIDGKQYIGDHSTNDLNDAYLGSGKYLFRAFKKFGRKKFKREILEFFPSKKEAFNAQEKYIKIHDTLSPNGYNISPAGGKESSSEYFSSETKRLIGEANKISLKGHKLSEETKQKISKKLKNKKVSEETKRKIGEANKISLKGRNLSEETKEKIGNFSKGKTYEKLYGKQKAKIFKEKMSLSRKGKKFAPGHKIGKSNKGKSWEEIYGIEGAKKRRENIKIRYYECL